MPIWYGHQSAGRASTSAGHSAGVRATGTDAPAGTATCVRVHTCCPPSTARTIPVRAVSLSQLCRCATTVTSAVAVSSSDAVVAGRRTVVRTKGCSTVTPRVATSSTSTGCQTPMLLSGASGFQSTNEIARSVSFSLCEPHWLCGRVTRNATVCRASALVAALCARTGAVTSSVNARNVPTTSVAAATRTPSTHTSAR